MTRPDKDVKVLPYTGKREKQMGYIQRGAQHLDRVADLAHDIYAGWGWQDVAEALSVDERIALLADLSVISGLPKPITKLLFREYPSFDGECMNPDDTQRFALLLAELERAEFDLPFAAQQVWDGYQDTIHDAANRAASNYLCQ